MRSEKIRKITAIILTLCTMALLLCACGSSSKNVSIEELGAAVDKALDKGDNMTEVPASTVKGFMKMDSSDYESYYAKINAYGANIDEYGIFKGKDSNQTKAISESLEAYLDLRLSSWMDEYMPDEKPKLSSAEVITSGNYVMYTILSDSDRSSAEEAFKSALK